MWKQPGTFPRLKQDRSKLAGRQSPMQKPRRCYATPGFFLSSWADASLYRF